MAAGQSDFEALHIMIVEDNPLTAIDITNILQALGISHTHIANDGHEALDWLQHNDPHCDVIFLDLRMPRMGGIDCMQRLADKNYHGSVIVLSGADEDTLAAVTTLAREHAIKLLGALPKPPDATHIAALLSRVSPGNA